MSAAREVRVELAGGSMANPRWASPRRMDRNAGSIKGSYASRSGSGLAAPAGSLRKAYGVAERSATPRRRDRLDAKWPSPVGPVGASPGKSKAAAVAPGMGVGAPAGPRRAAVPTFYVRRARRT